MVILANTVCQALGKHIIYLDILLSSVYNSGGWNQESKYELMLQFAITCKGLPLGISGEGYSFLSDLSGSGSNIKMLS